MFKFMRGRGSGGGGHLSQDRIKDLFALSKLTRHGFPNNPTALAHDPSLGLIAIATKKSEVRVYGRPGVEYTGELDPESVVKEMHFIPDQRAQLVLLMEDGIVQLWQLSTEPDSFVLQKVKSLDFFVRGEGSMRQAITLLVTQARDQVLVGTTGGNVYSILLSSFSLSEEADAVLYQDVVLHSAAEQLLGGKPAAQGPVEVLAERPGHPGVFLIGFQRGLVVLWNAGSRSADRVFNSGQQLESATWLSSGQGFTSCHLDGSLINWKVTDGTSPAADASRIPYGPFPCKPIGRVFHKTIQHADNLLVFTGGMPRSTYGDKMTVSLIQGDQDSGKHQVLDFTSKVIDLLVLDEPDKAEGSEWDNPVALLILLEEELVAVDLRHPDWLPIKLPLLSSVHSSGITSCVHYSDLADQVYEDILAAGRKQDEGKYSTADWPITGGCLPVQTEAPTTTTADETLTEAVTQPDPDQPQDVIPGLTPVATTAASDEGDGCTMSKTADDDKRPDPDKQQTDEQADPEITSSSDPASVKPADSLVSKKGTKTKDILITGHEDGSILLWDASDVSLRHILTINTRKYFLAIDGDIAPIDGDDAAATTASPDPEDADGSEWPPFRKVGTFDPYSDDTRLAIRRLALCPMTGGFAAAGTAGQVLYLKLTTESGGAKPIPVHAANLVNETTGFVWKGHDQLHVKSTAIKMEPGYEADFVIQVSPPAAVTALSLHSEWHLLSAGTAHGFLVYDLIPGKVLLTKCTLNPADLAATAGGDVLISRRKSFKKSLRESFRRLRRGRGASTRAKKTAAGATPDSSPEKQAPTPATSPIRSIASAAASADDGDTGKPVERQIEARQDDGLGSMIRTISYATANITSVGSAAPTLWIGTNAGAVLIYTLTLPDDEEKRLDGGEEVAITLAKEIQLKHRAPVILIQVVDSTAYPLPGPHEVSAGKAKAPSTIGHQRVLIASEEQFKLFTLPNLKPDRKSKLTAHEGSRARRVTIAQFAGSIDAAAAATDASPSAQLRSPVEHCLTCCSNQGDVSVYSIGDLKRVQNHVSVIKREDVHGIASVVLTTRGEGLFLHSPSEFQRFSLSAHKVVKATGFVTVPPGARPVLVEAPVVPVADKEAEAADGGAAAAAAAASVPDGCVLGTAIKEETEEEIAAAVAAVTATAAATSVLLDSVMDPPPPTPATTSAKLADLLPEVGLQAQAILRQEESLIREPLVPVRDESAPSLPPVVGTINGFKSMEPETPEPVTDEGTQIMNNHVEQAEDLKGSAAVAVAAAVANGKELIDDATLDQMRPPSPEAGTGEEQEAASPDLAPVGEREQETQQLLDSVGDSRTPSPQVPQSSDRGSVSRSPSPPPGSGQQGSGGQSASRGRRIKKPNNHSASSPRGSQSNGSNGSNRQTKKRNSQRSVPPAAEFS